jgi:RNA polymerase sigma-70 factor (ECF subfamily)
MDHTYSSSGVAARLLFGRESSRFSNPTDAELVASSLREPDAFTQLFERHWQALFRFCQSRAGSAGEDIAAEAFRVAFDRRRRYDARYSDARPWLFGIATNLLRDHFRTAKREEHKLTRSAALDSAAQTGDELNDLERQLLGPQLADALQGLPAADRDALLLLAWADLDYEQISQALGVPLGTVRSRIHRARQRVRDYLEAGENDDARNEARS